MLSKNQIKKITSLRLKKFRNIEKMFIAEGEKIFADLLKSDWKINSIFHTDHFIPKKNTGNSEVIRITEDEMAKISSLTTPQSVLALVEFPLEENIPGAMKGLNLVLDGIMDPGNLGTIIRIADWFGIQNILCSENSVECFNPKVVQSAMGSLFRTKIFYLDLDKFFNMNASEKKLPVYGTTLTGKNIFKEKLSPEAFILIGNESNGISKELQKYISNSISIPNYGNSSIDSLNAAIATGIVCAEFRRAQ